MIQQKRQLLLPLATTAILGLALLSLFVGGYELSPSGIFHDPQQREMFFISRVPRTLALIFSAVAMSVSGVIMQMITQNKFVEPTTAGTSQWAGLGILFCLLTWSSAPPLARMLIASGFAFLGTIIFLTILNRVGAAAAVQGSVLVPLIGIMLGAVVGAASTFIAGRFRLLQTMSAWRSGGFSNIVRGFYEPLWAVVIIAIVAWVVADRFTVAGLGKEIATNVGLNYRATIFLGSTLVALATGVTSVVVGFIPFLGLIVPNFVSMLRGDDLRSNIGWVAVIGVGLLLICDLIGRVIVAPLEIPASVIMGVIGSVGFIWMVVSQRANISA